MAGRKSNATTKDSDAVPSCAAVAHGELRYSQGYTPAMLVHESILVCLASGRSKGYYISKHSMAGKDTMMLHSTVTSKGQTTMPEKIRKALRIKPGDRLEYEVRGDRATIRVHPGIRSLKGALASNKGKGISFAEIREAAAEAARHEGAR